MPGLPWAMRGLALRWQVGCGGFTGPEELGGAGHQRPEQALDVGYEHRHPGGAWALADLRKVLTVIGAGLTETELAVPQVHTQLTPGGHIADPALRGRITALISNLAQQAAADRPARAA